MSVEAILFLIIGILTVTSAAAMLISKNAVHSALFLIVNFIGVAMLYLMLEAPFLALVQIAVYAGAIMVLFLFVIMLLGAERTGAGSHLRRFPWLPPVGMGLAAFLVIMAAWALGQGSIDTRLPAEGDARIRFVHAAPAAVEEEVAVAVPPGGEPEGEASGEATDAGVPAEGAPAPEEPVEPVDALEEPSSRPAVPSLPEDREFVLLIDGELVDTSFSFGDATDYYTVTPGAHTVTLRSAVDATDLRAADFELGTGESATLIVAGEVDLEFYSVTQPEDAGLTIFNAYTAADAVAIGDLQNEMFNPTVNSVSNVKTGRQVLPVLDALPYGAATEVPLVYPAGFHEWIVYEPIAGVIDADYFVSGDNAQRLERSIILRLTDAAELAPDQSGLIVIAPERRPDGSLRAVATEVQRVDVPAFGSPASVGVRLFTDYLLPFQLVAMLLLAAMVGVIVITYRGEHVPKPSRTTRRKVSRPLTSVIASQTGADLTSGAPQLPERTETPAGD